MPVAKHQNTSGDYRKAKDLRLSSSFAERLLWNGLRQVPKETGFKFRRQHPFHPYIVDFVCLRLRLVIEVDGESHDARQEYDRAREAKLRRIGCRILRFSNDDVYKNLDGVIETILGVAGEMDRAAVVPTPPLAPPVRLRQGFGATTFPDRAVAQRRRARGGGL